MPGLARKVDGESYTVPLFINGEERRGDKVFDVVSAGTGKVAHQCSSASVKDCDDAVAAAAEALKTWRNTTPAERRDIFLRAADIFEKRSGELAQIMTEETGATAGWGEFMMYLTINLIRDLAGRITGLAGSYPATMDPNISAIVMNEPYGVVLSIAPWNGPYLLGARAIACPLAAGNTVVLKATELCPRTMLSCVSAFVEAGVPKGALNMLTHDPPSAATVTTSLIANPHVKKINFTGSSHVGRIIAKTAGEYLKPVVLELGGKAPAIVWEDADLKLAARECASGAFHNAGQVCMSTERILVHKNVKAKFCEEFKAAIETLAPSKGDAQILVQGSAVERNKKLINDAVSKGASVLLGDQAAEEITKTRLRPIVIDKVTEQMDIYQTESFGPTVSLVDIETEEEALRIANDTEYGLSSAVFTEDLRRGLRFARGIETGAVHINSMTIRDEAALPHGGVKASGYGRFNTLKGLEEWVTTKTVTFRN